MKGESKMNVSEAYDFSLFEERMDNTAPAKEERREQRRRIHRNVVELPQKELEKNARAKINPLKAMAAVACFAVIFATVVSVVYSQVQLTELTERINQSNAALAEAQSLEVQLSMRGTQMMNDTEVENYVVNELGMTKISGSQVTYLNVAQNDKGTVVQSADGGSVLDKALKAAYSLFS